jgi:ATP-dependent exoDNAse (exonuclease V) beta subunit
MYFQLDRLGIDVSQEGGNPLTDSAAVEVVLSALMWADHPGDRRWAFHVRSTALADRISDDGANFIRQLAEERGLTETIEFLADGMAGVCDTRDTIRLRQLTHMAMLYQQNAAPRLRDFVRMVREKRVERPQVAPVRVMTIHQAKGLEFDAVVLPELNGDLARIQDAYVTDVPTLGDPPVAISRWIDSKSRHFLSERWQREFGKKVRSVNTEALCTLYVAMTRARRALYMITQPSSKVDFGNKNAASLVYHTLQCDQDPTAENSILFETGDPHWYRLSGENAALAVEAKAENDPLEIQFQPLPPVPRRNRIQKAKS